MAVRGRRSSSGGSVWVRQRAWLHRFTRVVIWVWGDVRPFYLVKCSPALLAVSGPPPVCGAGGAGDGTTQHPKVRPLLGARAVAAVNVDPELVYLLPEVMEDLREEVSAMRGSGHSLTCTKHSI